MEIIKKGNIPTQKKPNGPVQRYKFVTTCPKCGCVFSYTKSDSYKEYNAPNYSGLIGTIIDCPCCREQMHYGTGKKVNNV